MLKRETDRQTDRQREGEGGRGDNLRDWPRITMSGEL